MYQAAIVEDEKNQYPNISGLCSPTALKATDPGSL